MILGAFRLLGEKLILNGQNQIERLRDFGLLASRFLGNLPFNGQRTVETDLFEGGQEELRVDLALSEGDFSSPIDSRNPGRGDTVFAVDAADIVELVNAKAGHPSASFNLKNADANADGSFTEADIPATANIIMR